MLKTLSITNYALIEHLEVEFDRGLNIITGETGAGKSIILGALSLILGDRANAQAIGDPTRKTTVEAVFDIGKFDLQTFFEEKDLDYDPQECCVRREVNAAGRSRAFVNDTPVQLSTLKELATRLIDIHSQHANMLLAQESFQIAMLDALAGISDKVDAYKQSYLRQRELRQELERMKEQIQRSSEEEDYIRFQHDQLAGMNLTENEDVELESRQQRLAHVAELKEQLWTLCHTLDNDEHSMLDDLRHVASRLQGMEQYVEELAGAGDRVNSSLIDLKDIFSTLTSLQETLTDDPDELARVDARLSEIYELERKHHAANVNELLQRQEEFAAKLADITHGEENIAELEAQLAEATQQATAQARVISENRHRAAQHLQERLVKKAALLGLNNLNFEVDMRQTDLGPVGCDRVDYLMAFNKNQVPVSVKDTASGGEISRVMLCVKTIVASAMSMPTIIFDEIDTGVSGDMASRIGDMMGDIGRTIQVIAITHLPQVAAHGDTHLLVYKTDQTDRTVTNMRRLNSEEHVAEIARMLSGKCVDKAAIENAQSLISQTKTR